MPPSTESGVITKTPAAPVPVILNIPLEKIVLETDAPYLTPVHHRRKRNEPFMVKYVAEEIAKIKNITINEVSRQTTKTPKEFFGI